MKVDLLQPEVWEELNAKLQKFCQLPEENSVRIFRGLHHAVLEIAQGTALFLSHKRSVAIIKGQTYAFDGVLPYLYKEAYEVQGIMPQNLFNLKSWFESLKKDTVFIMIAEDHPITGEIFNWQEIDELCQQKRIFCIRVSHANHFFDKQEVKPYSVRICSQTPEYAFAICGEKFKSPPLVAQNMYWSQDEVEKNLFVIPVVKTNSVDIAEFECHLPKGFKPYFAPNAKRIFDRAVFYHEELSGDAIQKNLAAQVNLKLQAPSWEIQLETTNLCRWNSTAKYYDWWEPKPAPQILQGLMMVDCSMLSEKGFLMYLQKAAQNSTFSL